MRAVISYTSYCWTSGKTVILWGARSPGKAQLPSPRAPEAKLLLVDNLRSAPNPREKRLREARQQNTRRDPSCNIFSHNVTLHGDNVLPSQKGCEIRRATIPFLEPSNLFSYFLKHVSPGNNVPPRKSFCNDIYIFFFSKEHRIFSYIFFFVISCLWNARCSDRFLRNIKPLIIFSP